MSAQKIYTKEELNALVANPDAAARKEVANVIKNYGKPLSEIVAMKPAERVAYILEHQPKAAGGKAPAAGTKLGAGAKPGVKTAVKAKPEPEPEPEEEVVEEEAEPEAGGGMSGEDAAALHEKLDNMAARLGEIERITVETHFLTRILLSLAGCEDTDVAGFKEGFYAQMLVDVDDAGND